MAKAKRLTDVAVQRIHATGRREEYPDLNQPGLRLIVQPSGKKSWAVRSRVGGKTFKYTIPGNYPTVSLAEAKEAAKEALKAAHGGEHPKEVERRRRAAEEARRCEEEARRKYTLRALCEEYVSYLKAKGKKGAAHCAGSAFRCHVFPYEVAQLPAKDVTARQLTSLVRKVFVSGKPFAAAGVRSYLSAAYNFARRAELNPHASETLGPFGVEVNPASAIDTIKTDPGDRHLSWNELRAYWAALLAGTQDLSSEVLKLALLAGGQRISMVIRAKVTDYDPDEKVLRLWDRKGRREKPREHLLPLGPKATALTERLVKDAKEARRSYLFPSNVGDKHIHAGGPGARVADISSGLESEGFGLRDLRRTAETLLAGMGVSRDHRAQLLSHGIGGVQAKHYDRHDYMKEKRAALLAWEAKLEEVPARNVVMLRKA